MFQQYKNLLRVHRSQHSMRYVEKMLEAGRVHSTFLAERFTFLAVRKTVIR